MKMHVENRILYRKLFGMSVEDVEKELGIENLSEMEDGTIDISDELIMLYASKRDDDYDSFKMLVTKSDDALAKVACKLSNRYLKLNGYTR